MTSALARAALVASLGLWAGAALAHAQLSASTPAHEAVLAKAPQQISLTFSAAVRLTAVSIVADDVNHALEVSAANAGTSFDLPVPSLAPGVYTIRWRALAQDTHVMSGEIRFTVSS